MKGLFSTAIMAVAGLALAGTASAVPLCSAGNLTVLSGTLSQGGSLSESGAVCTIGIYTFSNFDVYGASIPTSISGFNLNVTASGNTLEIITNPNITGDDIQLSFQISPGITGETLQAGAGSQVSEYICSSPGTFTAGDNVGCTPVISQNQNWNASNGGSVFSSVTFANTDYVFKDWSNGSEVFQSISTVPEPMTFSLLGLGLLGVGFASRRLRK